MVLLELNSTRAKPACGTEHETVHLDWRCSERMFGALMA